VGGAKTFPKKKTFLPLQELANDGKPNFCKSATTLIFDLQVLVVCKFKSYFFAKNHQEEVTPNSFIPRATQPWLLSAMELLH